MTQVVVALGANIGEATATLAAARRRLEADIGRLTAASPVVRTAAWGVEDQPDFYNQVVLLELKDPGGAAGAGERASKATLHRLLDLTQAIENDLGRRREQRWGPRTIDLDLILVGDLRYEDERLSLPHPWWAARDFVGGLIRDSPELRAVAFAGGFV